MCGRFSQRADSKKLAEEFKVAEVPAVEARCIIPAGGFYEWQRSGGRKHPFFFRMRDERPFGLAGLWKRWEGEVSLNPCAILTTDANEVLRPAHDRMPAILHPDDYESWLGAGVRELGVSPEGGDLL